MKKDVTILRLTLLVMSFLLSLACNAHQLSGHVYDQDGKPVAGATVSLTVPAFDKQLRYECTTDNAGGYELQVEETGQETRCRVTVSAPGHIFFKDLIGIVSMSEDCEMDFTLYNRVVYPAGKRCTIVLPVAPDASAGRYYRLYDVVDDTVRFLREPEPKACVPYLFYPERDYQVDVAGLDLEKAAERRMMPGIAFWGEFCAQNQAYNSLAILDETDDCRLDYMGGLHAYMGADYMYFNHRHIRCIEEVTECTPYMPMLKDGRVWNYQGAEGDFREYIDGETELYGETWKNVYIEQPLGSAPRLEKLMREQAGRVYAYWIGGKMSQMADFSLSEISAFPFKKQNQYLLYTGCDSIVSQGHCYRRLHLDVLDYKDTPAGAGSVTWIEGVGYGCGIYWSGLDYNVMMTIDLELASDKSARLLSCYDGDECIYRNDDVEVLSGIRNIPAASVISSHAIYDLQGRRINRPSKGLYIQDGKKRVVISGDVSPELLDTKGKEGL